MDNNENSNSVIKIQFKESFFSVKFIVFFITLIISFLGLIFFNNEYLLSIFELLIYLCLFFVVLFIIGFFNGVKMKKNILKIKSGKLKYAPFIIDNKRFLEECKTGLIYSIVRINGQIYELDVQLDKINSVNYDKFICYINNNEIIGLDNFLDYKFDGNHTLRELENIEFLEYNNDDPKKYFSDHQI